MLPNALQKGIHTPTVLKNLFPYNLANTRYYSQLIVKNVL